MQTELEEKPKHNIGKCAPRTVQKYARQDPFPRLPFTTYEEPADKLSWAISAVAIAMLIVGVLLP